MNDDGHKHRLASLGAIHRKPAVRLATVTRLHEGRADEELDDIRLETGFEPLIDASPR